MPTDRIVTADADGDLAAEVRTKLAANFADPASTEGAALVTAVGVGGSLSAPLDANYYHSAKALLPTGYVAESIPRSMAYLTNVTVLSSGRLSFVAVYLYAGQVVSTISFISATTAADAPTNQWFALYDLSRNKLAVTNDNTSTAWGAFTLRTLTLTSPYTVTTSGLYYVGAMVKATTVPSFYVAAGATAINTLAPIAAGYAATNTGLTNPASAPNPAAALTASQYRPCVLLG